VPKSRIARRIDRYVAKIVTLPREGLPQYLVKPERRDDWDRPTAWLLGTQLLGSLRSLLLSSVHHSFDLRDWMTPRTEYLNEALPADAEEYWLDFFADTGDSPRLVYRLAQLLQAESLDVDGTVLPRGRALIMGGDTAYPVANRVALVERVCAPFAWARESLELGDAPEVPILAVPGNHDYYDTLDGFARQFRTPCGVPPGPNEPENKRLALGLPGYEQQQCASYFAAKLPCGWWLLALDAELGIDDRQVAYFKERLREIAGEEGANKIIVVTSRPLIVNRARVAPEDEVAEACARIGLVDALSDPTTSEDPAKKRQAHGEHQPQPGAEEAFEPDAQVYLSGDVHAYQRYYGESAQDAPVTDPLAVSASSYTSVVCGLGGAFHHPNQVRHGDVRAACLFPDEDDSARAIGKVLIEPFGLGVFRAGAAGVLGGLVALLVYLLTSGDGTGGPVGLLLRWRAGLGADGELDAGGRTLGSVGLLVAWALVVWLAMLWTRIMRARMWASPEEWPQAWLFRACRTWPVRRVFDLFGARPRVVHSALLVGWAWIAVAVFPLVVWRVSPLHWNDLNNDTVLSFLVVIVFVAGTGFLGFMGGWSFRIQLLFVLPGVLFGLTLVLVPYQWTMFLLARPALAVPLLAALLLVPYAFGAVGLRLKRRGRSVTLVLAGLAFYAGAIALPLVVPLAIPPRSYPAALLSLFVGSIFACMLLGWYVVGNLQCNGHGNTAGSVARIDRYGVFLRMKLTQDAIELWAIAPDPDEMKTSTIESRVRAKLVDHFTVKARPPARGGAKASEERVPDPGPPAG